MCSSHEPDCPLILHVLSVCSVSSKGTLFHSALTKVNVTAGDGVIMESKWTDMSVYAMARSLDRRSAAADKFLSKKGNIHVDEAVLP